MIIKYTNFSDGIHRFTLTGTAVNLGLENLFIGDINVDCKMDKSQHQIVLTCEIYAKTNFICDRCDQQYETELKSEFVISFLFAKSENMEDDYNVRYLSPEQDKIDITKDVFEYAELSIPMKKLCSDDCKGLCSKCGTNLNEKKCDCKFEINNDIWAPLEKLKK
jgi:uncharacterized protein